MSQALLDILKVTQEELDEIHSKHKKYFSFSILKKSGKKRRLSSPSPRLKKLQKKILHEILYKVKAHANAHGFVCKKSPTTSASAQFGNKLFLTIDIEDYFGSINKGHVIHAFYFILGSLNNRNVGKPQFSIKEDATLLADLCLYHNILPQGAPTSPALANIVTYKLDSELEQLSTLNQITYTRYADDMTFGCKNLTYDMDKFLLVLKTNIRNHGFTINPKKTRFLRPHKRQSITGVVVNDKLGVAKGYYQNTKAAIHNIKTEKTTPSFGELRRLRGRIEWIKSIDANKGGRLLDEFKNVTTHKTV